MKIVSFTVQCCVCGRVRGPSGNFLEHHGAIEGPISHGYCPDCARTAMETLRMSREFPPIERNSIKVV